MSMDLSWYINTFDYDFSMLRVNDMYFKNTRTYSWLCEDYRMYDMLSEYKYMLIYQNDAWCFSNELERFIEADYDYYGGPWKGGLVHGYDSVGNGGCSMRKNSKLS